MFIDNFPPIYYYLYLEHERDRIKKMKVANMFRDQVKEREEIVQKQKNNELKLSRMLDAFAQAEVEKENERQKEKVSTALQEMDMYNNYLKELAKNNAKEEERNEEILNNTMMEARRIYDVEKCEDERKRKELLKVKNVSLFIICSNFVVFSAAMHGSAKEANAGENR